MKGWKPEALEEQMQDGAWSYEAVAVALRERGWTYTHWSVRKWVKPESTGPQHPVQAMAIADVLGCEYQDLVKT